jgi:hypothetical protein
MNTYIIEIEIRVTSDEAAREVADRIEGSLGLRHEPAIRIKREETMPVYHEVER